MILFVIFFLSKCLGYKVPFEFYNWWLIYFHQLIAGWGKVKRSTQVFKCMWSNHNYQKGSNPCPSQGGGCSEPDQRGIDFVFFPSLFHFLVGVAGYQFKTEFSPDYLWFFFYFFFLLFCIDGKIMRFEVLPNNVFFQVLRLAVEWKFDPWALQLLKPHYLFIRFAVAHCSV